MDGFGESTVVQPDGKIVVAGYASNGVNYEFALVRYNTDGSLDNGFGTGGITLSYFGDTVSYGYAVALQTDGKIIVAGTAYNGSQHFDDFAVARYNTNGTIDNSFGSGGIATTDFGNSDDYGLSVAIQQDGRIIVGGSSDIYDVAHNVSGFALVRYNINGTLDTTFGSNGMIATNFYNSFSYGHSLALQSDGKIILAGSASYVDTIVSVALVRYTTSGSIDSSFATNGIDTTIIGQNSSGNAVAIQQDGKIVVAGFAGDNFALLKYDTSGTLDTIFGLLGIDTTGFGNTIAVGNAVAIQSDNKIVVAGSIGSAFALARYQTNGALDTVDGVKVKITTPFFGIDDEAYSVAIQPDGKVIAAGYTEDFTLYKFVVARYIPSLTLGLIDLASSINSALIYPNPIHDNATLDFQLAKEETINIRLVDMMGRVVQSFVTDENMIEGSHHLILNLQSFPQGNYILSITNSSSQSLSIEISKL